MKNLLKQILNDCPQSIKAEVAEEALEHEDPQTFFKDLLQTVHQWNSWQFNLLQRHIRFLWQALR